MKLEVFIKKYGLSKHNSPERINKYIEEASQKNLDPVLMLLIKHYELYNYSLFERAERIKINDQVSGILKKYNLEKIQKELLFTASLILVFCKGSKGMDDRMPSIVPYYKEYDSLINVLKNESKTVNEILIKTTTKTYKFKSDWLIDRMLWQIANFYLNDNVQVKVYDVEYDFKGRPQSKKTQSLKKSCSLLNEYLTIKGKLLPTKDVNKKVKISDNRRKFLADFLLSIGAINPNDFQSNPKDYINSLLS